MNWPLPLRHELFDPSARLRWEFGRARGLFQFSCISPGETEYLLWIAALARGKRPPKAFPGPLGPEKAGAAYFFPLAPAVCITLVTAVM